MRRLLRAVRKHPWRTLAILALLLTIGANGLAAVHAHALTNFTDAGDKTRPPERLGLGDKVGVLFTGARVPKPVNRRTPAAVGLPFDTHLDEADGARLEYWHVPREGARDVVVLFHGYAGCKAQLLDAARVFGDLGHHALLVDFRGSGGSSGTETTIGYREGEDVAAAVAFARARHPGGRIVCYGQSMGAAAILRAIHAHGVSPDGIILEAVFDRLLSTIENRFDMMRVPSLPMAQLLVFWGGQMSGFDGFEHDPVRYARDVRCPALGLVGTKDRRAPVADSRAVLGAMPVETRLVKFYGARHWPLLGFDRDRWTGSVRTFLGDVLHR